MKRPAKIAVRKARDGQFYFVIVAGNGEPFANGEGYTRRSDAVRAANRFLITTTGMRVVDETVVISAP